MRNCFYLDAKFDYLQTIKLEYNHFEPSENGCTTQYVVEMIPCDTYLIERVVFMMQHRIKLRPDEVKDFVAAATKCACDVDISYNSFIVDAKSIIGVLGLNFNQVLTVSYNGYDEEFEKYLKKFAVAC